MRKTIRAFGAALALAGAAAAEEKPLLIELPPGNGVADVGAGGFTVVGQTLARTAFYWMPTVGFVPMGGTAANAISRDGRTILGRAFDAEGRENAAIWQGGQEWRTLGSFTPDAQACDLLLSGTFGASDDGRVVVGLGWNGCGLAHAFRWEEATGMVDLGSTVPGQSSRANNVSGDGRVVVGWQENETGFWMGAKWIGGRQELILGPHGVVGEAKATNRDGSLIVGTNCNPEGFDMSAWAWHPETGVVCYPVERERRFPNNPYLAMMLATSDDGRVIGGAHSFGLDSEAVLWIDGQPHFIKDYLREHGVPDAFEGWVNTGFIMAVTPDGRVLAGQGAGPTTFQGYLIVLPELGPRASSER